MFGTDYREPPFQTIEEKIERLRLSDARVEELKSMIVEDFTGPYDSDDYYRSYEIIEVDKIVGFRTAHFVNNWYEALDTKVLHKPITLERFDPENPDKFDEYLLFDNNYDPPSVIEIDGKYFVDGDGTNMFHTFNPTLAIDNLINSEC